jgi:hypothetical protein
MAYKCCKLIINDKHINIPYLILKNNSTNLKESNEYILNNVNYETMLEISYHLICDNILNISSSNIFNILTIVFQLNLHKLFRLCIKSNQFKYLTIDNLISLLMIDTIIDKCIIFCTFYKFSFFPTINISIFDILDELTFFTIIKKSIDYANIDFKNFENIDFELYSIDFELFHISDNSTIVTHFINKLIKIFFNKYFNNNNLFLLCNKYGINIKILFEYICSIENNFDHNEYNNLNEVVQSIKYYYKYEYQSNKLIDLLHKHLNTVALNIINCNFLLLDIIDTTNILNSINHYLDICDYNDYNSDDDYCDHIDDDYDDSYINIEYDYLLGENKRAIERNR